MSGTDAPGHGIIEKNDQDKIPFFVINTLQAAGDLQGLLAVLFIVRLEPVREHEVGARAPSIFDLRGGASYFFAF